MPKVFPIHEQLRRGNDGKLVLAHDTRPAERFGIRQAAIFSDGATKVPIEDLIDGAKEKLADFTQEDFLICLGAPDLIALAIMLAASHLGWKGPLNLLVWNGKDFCYDLKTIPLEGCNHDGKS